jgi:serralysin
VPDIAGDNTTTSSISVGSSVSSSIETPNDHDWFRIELVAGQTITITLNGTGATPLSDPYLRLRDASGNVLAQNDDSGGSLNSTVNFTANATGTYYIDAAAWASPTGDTSTGSYTLQVNPYTPPPVATVDQFANQLTNGYWGGNSHHFNVSPGGNLTVNLTALTSDGINLARLALRQWSDIIGVTFTEVTSGGQITFDDNQEGAFSSANYSAGVTTSAIVNVSTQWLADYGTTINTYGYQTYIHEIGHALGLGHAGNYNSTATYSSDATFLNDAWPMSIMSYFSVDENPYFSNQGYTRVYLGTPMVADIAAMSVLYGLSTTTRLGATTYGFNSNAGNVFNAALYPSIAYTVFDSGGIDTLDYSGFSQNQIIDLREAGFSSVGGESGNVSIALGTIIENAIGGSGNDRIIGNEAANVLRGEGGADTLTGGGGSDVFSGTRAGLNGDTITDFSVGDQIFISDAAMGSFSFSLSGNTLTYSGGSLTLSAPVSGPITASAAAGGGINLSIGSSRDAANDFNGDGRSDILFRQSNGAIFDFLGKANGGMLNNGDNIYTVVDNAWKIAGTGDFNGDGRDDILWRNDAGAIFNFLGKANGGVQNNGDNSYLQLSPNLTVMGIGDFNGDNRDDILFRKADGTITNWLGTASGGFIDNSSNLFTTVDNAFKVVGVGDFNGDGRDDILFRSANGAIFNFLGTASGGVINNGDNIYTVVDNVWHVAGIGDFNGDGMDDILWRNDSGAIFYFLGTATGGVSNNGNASYSAMSLAWEIAAIGDYNGDGRDDILWRNSNGTIIDWLGNQNGGFSDNSGNLYTTVAPEWKIEPHMWTLL